jgi:uncharacterized protein with PQ loop repeat
MFLIFFNVLSNLGTYHQIFKIHRRKSVEDISLVNISCVWTNVSANLLYAHSINNRRLTTTFGNTWLSISGLLLSVVYFKNKQTQEKVTIKQ